MSAFTPRNGASTASASTKLLACTATSATLTLLKGASSVRLHNQGTERVYVELGPTALLPDTTNWGSMCVPAGGVALLALNGAGSISAICEATKTSTLHVTLGDGGTTL